jgi:hypothetical protein
MKGILRYAVLSLVLIMAFSVLVGCKKKKIQETKYAIKHEQSQADTVEQKESTENSDIKLTEPPVADGEKQEIPKAPNKADTYYAEEVVRNFGELFPMIASRNNTDFGVLDNVIIKDSEFYKEVKTEVENYRSKKARFVYEDFYISSINASTDNQFEVKVEEKLAVTIDGKTERSSRKVSYVVEVRVNKVGIVKRVR